MDFIAAKHTAAREIALAFGVPPMLLGLPGDNTYANYAEANRSFWRQTVLPLVGRTAQSLAAWLAPDAPALRLAPDLDRIDALADEREALWRRIGAAGSWQPSAIVEGRAVESWARSPFPLSRFAPCPECMASGGCCAP